MKRKPRIQVIAVLLMFLLLSACDGKNAPPAALLDATQEGLPVGPVSITVSHQWGGTDTSTLYFLQVIDEFEATTGHTVVNLASTVTPYWESQVISDFLIGSEPDILQFYAGTQANRIIEFGRTVSIEEIREIYPDYCDNISKEALKSVVSPVDGNAYVIPTNGYWESLYVNRDILDELQLNIPTTWPAFLATCSQLKQAGYTPLTVSLNIEPHYLFEFLMFNHTGLNSDTPHNQTIPKEHGDAAFNIYTQTLEDFELLYRLGYLNDNCLRVSGPEAANSFYNKQAVFLVDGHWARASIEANSLDPSKVELIGWPTSHPDIRPTDSYIGGFSMGFMISRKAWENPAKRDACVTFIETLSSDTWLSRFSNSNFNPSKAPIALEVTGVQTPLLESCQNFIQPSSGNVSAVQDNWTPAAKEYLFSGAIGLMITGEMTAEEIVDEFIRRNQMSHTDY